jgi:hypothetical protein
MKRLVANPGSKSWPIVALSRPALGKLQDALALDIGRRDCANKSRVWQPLFFRIVDPPFSCLEELSHVVLV